MNQKANAADFLMANLVRGVRRFSSASGKNELTRLANGVTVVSSDAGELLSSVSIYAAAGCRNETSKTAGSAQFLKALPFLSTKSKTNVYIAKESESLGVKYSSTANRENVGLHATFLKGHLDSAVKSLVDTVSTPTFWDWEVTDHAATVAMETSCAQTALLNDAHKGLFRGTLGKALNGVNPGVSADALKAYYQVKHLTLTLKVFFPSCLVFLLL